MPIAACVDGPGTECLNRGGRDMSNLPRIALGAWARGNGGIMEKIPLL